MPLKAVLAEVAGRYRRVRSGLDVGFGDPEFCRVLRELRGGVWMSIGREAEFPFEDAQFEVVVMEGSMVSRSSIREANRVLLPDGCLFFTVPERTRKQAGYNPPEIYRLIREGFNILSVSRPKWWRFGLDGRTLTVCAQKKAWREHKSFIRESSLPFTPFRSRT